MPPPQGLTVKALSATEILVTWTQLNHTVYTNGTEYPVEGYTVFVRRYGTKEWMRYATTVIFKPYLGGFQVGGMAE